MRLVLDEISEDMALVTVVGKDARVQLEIRKDPTRRDGNIENFYATTFVKIDLAGQELRECTTHSYMVYEKVIGRHPYLAEGERVVSLNTGIPELDLIPVAVGEDYARIYHFPYPGTPICYTGGSYEVTISNQRLILIHGVRDFLKCEIVTLSEKQLEIIQYELDAMESMPGRLGESLKNINIF